MLGARLARPRWGPSPVRVPVVMLGTGLARPQVRAGASIWLLWGEPSPVRVMAALHVWSWCIDYVSVGCIFPESSHRFVSGFAGVPLILPSYSPNNALIFKAGGGGSMIWSHLAAQAGQLDLHANSLS